MTVLGKGQGIFDLHNSDACVGSFLQKKDVQQILYLPASSLDSIPFKQKDGVEVIDERLLQKLWYSKEISGSPKSQIGRAKASLDEMILIQIIRTTYPDSVIEHQASWGSKSLDFRLIINGVTKIVEFHGPSHFASSQYNKTPENPFLRKEKIEHDFGVECVIWPYWIQRCTSNLRAIFEPDVQGYGALWSTNVHFGSFIFPNSAQIIETISDRFNAKRDGGYGYFYGPNTAGRNNPEHPIIAEIRKNKKSIDVLVPQGHSDIKMWLPNSLQNI